MRGKFVRGRPLHRTSSQHAFNGKVLTAILGGHRPPEVLRSRDFLSLTPNSAACGDVHVRCLIPCDLGTFALAYSTEGVECSRRGSDAFSCLGFPVANPTHNTRYTGGNVTVVPPSTLARLFNGHPVPSSLLEILIYGRKHRLMQKSERWDHGRWQ